MKRPGNFGPRRTPLRASSTPMKRRAGTKAEQAAEDARKYGPPGRPAWVRTQPCIVRGCPRPTENAHVVKIDGGMGRKSHYRAIAPVCGCHHRDGPNSLHQLGPRSFERLHGISLAACAAATQRAYEAYCGEFGQVATCDPAVYPELVV
jgi:hypothetical protein